MRRFTTVLSLVALGLAQPAAAQGVASATVVFSNETSRCINVADNAVTLYITSITLDKNNNWLTDTTGVGAQADLTLISGLKGSVTFPRAQEVSTNSVGGKLVRANVNFPVLAQYSFDSDSKVTAIDVPVIFLRRKGDSAVARYAKAMIEATKQLPIPANPFVQGVEAAGKIAGAFLQSAREKDPDGVTPANFRISHTLSRTNSCNENDLSDGIQAKIADVSGMPPSAVIHVADKNKYCFYRTGSPSDPDVSYSNRPSTGGCPGAAPAEAAVLQNPQVIYLVHAVSPRGLRAARAALEGPSDPAGARAGDQRLQKAEIQRALSLCGQAGIAARECLGAR
jgi:hypothetical protein